MHFRRNILSFPNGEYSWVEIHNILGPFTDLFRIKYDVVVVKVKDHRYI